MPIIIDTINAQLPDDWRLSTLTSLGDEWQVNATDGEMVVSATGESIEDALANAAFNANNGIYLGRLFCLGRLSAADSPTFGTLLERIGLAKPPEPPLKRRSL